MEVRTFRLCLEEGFDDGEWELERASIVAVVEDEPSSYLSLLRSYNFTRMNRMEQLKKVGEAYKCHHLSFVGKNLGNFGQVFKVSSTYNIGF